MKSNLYGMLLCLIVVITGTAKVVKTVAGRTGNGKSYITSLMGCQSKQCSGSESCTQKSLICDMKDYFMHDSVGADDSKGSYSVNHKGKDYPLTSMTFPIYELLSTLEAQKASEVEFYFVKDANNVKTGQSEGYMLEFITNTLQCPVTYVLNKFREDNPDHKKNENLGSIIVKEFQTTKPNLQGKACHVPLASNWREKLFANDMKAVKASVTAQQCTQWRAHHKEMTNQCESTPNFEADDNNQCQYYGDIGGSHCVKRQKITRRCKRREPNKGMRTDNDCINRRNASNDAKRRRNREKQEQKDRACQEKNNLNSRLQECTAVPNF